MPIYRISQGVNGANPPGGNNEYKYQPPPAEERVQSGNIQVPSLEYTQPVSEIQKPVDAGAVNSGENPFSGQKVAAAIGSVNNMGRNQSVGQSYEGKDEVRPIAERFGAEYNTYGLALHPPLGHKTLGIA